MWLIGGTDPPLGSTSMASISHAPSKDSNPGRVERQLADIGNALNHTTGHVGRSQGWKETQAVGHLYDLFLGRFRSKTDISGGFICKTLIEMSRSMTIGTIMVQGMLINIRRGH